MDSILCLFLCQLNVTAVNMVPPLTTNPKYKLTYVEH